MGPGPRAYDLAEALLVAAGEGHLTESDGIPALVRTLEQALALANA
ncbi:MAG TPA: hypothetical protein VFW50_30820 [Streptosporangiaceae bacterium]|nr:hypothetical protein [Streptosporangiaceae bacterium]